MDLCERCYGRLDAGSVQMEDGRLLCPVCLRQQEYDRHCDFLFDQKVEREMGRDDNEGPFDYEPEDLELQIREGSIE